ncbi:MAG: hypothetical protein ACE15C_13020 [Phycisphaerae bacterium]
MLEHEDILRRVADVMDELQITYMVVGSVASSVYGEPRSTQDVDIVADLRYGDIPRLCEKFPEPEYYMSPEAAGQAIRLGGQFKIICPTTGEKIDVMVVRQDAWGLNQISRRRPVRVLEDRDVYLAAPEDVIIAKMLYYREGQSDKHLRDIAGILKVSGDEVDRAYIDRWAEKMGLTEIWRMAQERAK